MKTASISIGALLIGSVVSCGGSAEPPVAANVPASSGSATGGGAPATSATAAVPGQAPDITAMLARTLKQVELARGLKAKKPVPGMFLRREEMIARVKEHVHREVPAEAIVREGRMQQMLGLLPEQFDYEAEMYAMLEEQLAGFYAPEDGTMYMAKDLEGDMSDATVFHELVHALQDQTWNLRLQTKYRPGEGDRSFSRSALAEGDATSAMLDPLLGKMGVSALDIPDEQAEQLLLSAAGSAGKRNTPPIMQRSLIAPYALGLRFVNGLRRKGGWKAVDAAWENPPVTSEQLLHPDKYAAKEPALAVDAPTSKALGTEFKEADQDTQGEMGLVLLFEQWAGEDKARALASGWGGDRGVYLQKGDEIAIAWRVRYDADVLGAKTPSGRGPKNTFAVLDAAFTKSAGKAAASARAGDFVCFERPHLGPLAFGYTGSEFLFTAGPAKPGATGFSSSATCAQAKAWMAELRKQKPVERTHI